MSFTIATKREVKAHFGTALYKHVEPMFNAMVEGSFFCDDAAITKTKIHTVKVSTENFVKLKPALQRKKLKIESKQGKLSCDAVLGGYTIRFLETGKKSVTSGDAQSTAKQERATLWVIKKILKEKKTYKKPGDITKTKAENQELLEIYPEIQDTAWLQHLFAQQQKIKELYGSKTFDVYNRDGGFMDWITALIRTKFGIAKKDSWNPADIWLIKNEDKVKKEITDCVSGKSPSLEKLNDLMIRQFNKCELIGISLKMPSTKTARYTKVNMNPMSEQPLDYKLTGIKFTMSINGKNMLDTTDTVITVSAGTNDTATFQIRQNSKGFNNLKFEPTKKGAGAARLGKTPLDMLKAMLSGDYGIGTDVFVNDWNRHPKDLPEFNEKQNEYIDKFKTINSNRLVTTGIKSTEFGPNVKASFGTTDWQNGYITSKLMQLNFIHAILTLTEKQRNSLLTNMLYLAMKQGPQFGPHGKLY